MKICFVLPRRFAFVGNYMAMNLQEKYQGVEFCAYVYLRSSYEYLKRQTDVKYTGMILDEDIHEEYKKEKLDVEFLKNLEKELGIPYLWPFIAVDRITMFNQLVREYPYDTPRYTHEEMLRKLQVTAKRVKEFLDREKPDYVVFSAVGAIGHMLLNYMALKRGIRALHIVTTSLKDRFAVSDRYDSVSDVDKVFKQNMAAGKRGPWYDAAQKYLAEFREAPHPYDSDVTPDKQPVKRAAQLSFLAPLNFVRSVRWFGHLIYEHLTTPYKRDYSYIPPGYYLLDRFKRKLRNAIGVEDLYEKFEPKDDFVFFPLHYEPEVSLLLLAPYATDQLNVIKQIARSLPVTYKLVVKEHPLMVIYRPRSFYKELKKIPNVKLINPSIPSWHIIPHAKLITTITGSAGWEGMLFKKPVISFGDQFYNVLSMVKRSRDYEQLPHLIKMQLENFKYDEEELLQYIAGVLEDAAELPFAHIWEQEPDEAKKKEGLKPLSDKLAQKMGLTPKVI